MVKSNLLKEQKNKLFYLAVGILAVGLVLFIWSTQVRSHENFISAGAHSFDKWMKADDNERVKIYKEESKQEFTSLEEAAKVANFTIKYPKNLKDKKLLGIFISHSNTLTLLYNNGFYITQRQSDLVPDYSSFVTESKEDKKKGNLKADQVPRLITVNNLIGMGVEPGINDFETYMQPRPGFAEWYEDGVIYSIYGDTIPLAKLINIANSMLNITVKTPVNIPMDNKSVEGGVSDEVIEKTYVAPSELEKDE